MKNLGKFIIEWFKSIFKLNSDKWLDVEINFKYWYWYYFIVFEIMGIFVITVSLIIIAITTMFGWIDPDVAAFLSHFTYIEIFLFGWAVMTALSLITTALGVNLSKVINKKGRYKNEKN